MNKILDLAKTFQQTSQKELENTSKRVQNVIKQHEENLIEQLQHANKNLAENIRIEQMKLIKSTAKMYRIPTIIALTVLILISIATMFLTWESKNIYQEMMIWKNSVEIAKEQNKGILLDRCKTDYGIKPCIAIDQNFMHLTWGENLKVLEIHEPIKK